MVWVDLDNHGQMQQGFDRWHLFDCFGGVTGELHSLFIEQFCKRSETVNNSFQRCKTVCIGNHLQRSAHLRENRPTHGQLASVFTMLFPQTMATHQTKFGDKQFSNGAHRSRQNAQVNFLHRFSVPQCPVLRSELAVRRCTNRWL